MHVPLQVSTPQLQEAHQYILSHCRELERQAAARGDITVEVGTNNMDVSEPVNMQRLLRFLYILGRGIPWELRVP